MRRAAREPSTCPTELGEGKAGSKLTCPAAPSCRKGNSPVPDGSSLLSPSQREENQSTARLLPAGLKSWDPRTAGSHTGPGLLGRTGTRCSPGCAPVRRGLLGFPWQEGRPGFLSQCILWSIKAQFQPSLLVQTSHWGMHSAPCASSALPR